MSGSHLIIQKISAQLKRTILNAHDDTAEQNIDECGSKGCRPLPSLVNAAGTGQARSGALNCTKLVVLADFRTYSQAKQCILAILYVLRTLLRIVLDPIMELLYPH